jgi:hypothetical protein
MTGDASQAHEFSDDAGYFGWLSAHPLGYVLNLRRRKGPLLHQARCSHINRHNNPGALTERGSPKVCAETKNVLRARAGANGYGSVIVFDKCPDCSP